MMCIRADQYGSRKLAKRSYVVELQELLRDTIHPRCYVHAIYNDFGRPYILIDVPVPSANGQPFSRFVYQKGRTHEQIARGIYKVVEKYPGSFLPSIYSSEDFFEKWPGWVQW